MHRPFGIVVIAVLVAINGVLAVIAGISGLVAGMVGSAVISIIFGLALLYLAWGLWTLQRWAWWSTLILEALSGLLALFTIILAPGAIGAWISLVLAAVIIIYLLQPGTRAAFREPARF